MSVGESVRRAGSGAGASDGGAAGASGGGASGGGAAARPLSGVWALLARLRRSPSHDSLSSVGSDATISFAFLSPSVSVHPQLAHDPAPLTDSYKKRVRDRNARRHHDRDLTLHRKYGLPRGDATFDAFSLPHFPNVRRSVIEPPRSTTRDRRAASESLPRCAAHVPGKGRAPLPPPPPRPASFVHSSSFGRPGSRKRPAPQPPVQQLPTLTPTDTGVGKENIHIDTLVKMKSNKSDQDKRPMSKDKGSMRYTPEKNNNKDDNNTKVPKIKREKSFLQQIFEGRKRSSAVESAPERLLPSISELDKQAADIIETYRLKPLSQNNRDSTTPNKGDAWFCTRCLRKYNSTVVTCLYCLPEQNNLRNGLTADFRKITKDTNIYTQIEDTDKNVASSSGANGIAMDEKQKLKQMLKEMKNSLPKRCKADIEEPQNISKDSKGHETKEKNSFFKIYNTKVNNIEIRHRPEETKTDNKRDSYYDPVTLRIGSIPDNVIQTTTEPQASSSKQNVKQQAAPKNEVRLVNVRTEAVKETAVITQPVVLIAPHPKEYGNVSSEPAISNNALASTSKVNSPPDVVKSDTKLIHNDSHDKQNASLKINSGINPIYIPQQSNAQDRRRLFFSNNEVPIRETKSGRAAEKHVASSTTVSETHDKFSTPTKQETKENIQTKENTPLRQKEPSKLEKVLPPPVDSQNLKPETSSQKHPPSSTSSVATSTSNTPISENLRISNANMVKMSVDEHSKRREWVNQLEQSIARGDEIAAAQAASKLAQLRLACSVLSFSSQIVGESSKNVTQSSSKPQSITPNNNKLKPYEPTQSTSKVNAAVQSMEIVSPKANAKNSSNKEIVSAKKINSQEAKPSSSSPKSDLSALSPTTSKSDSSAKIIETNDQIKNVAGASSSKAVVGNGSNFVSISIWVEDREATRGPVRLSIPRDCTLGELRRRAEASLGLHATLQRWIVGRSLCTRDGTLLSKLAGADLVAPFYLCLVEDTKTKSEPSALPTKPSTWNTQRLNETADVYLELMQLERVALVPNSEAFECGVCMEPCALNAGAVLRECVHGFCRQCLSDLVRHCAEPTIACPAPGCPGTLQEREIRALVNTEEYERWLARGLAAAESGARHAFHCRTRDCSGWALCEPGVRRFPCPLCTKTNCVPCQTIHEGETCEQYRTRLQTAAKTLGGADSDGGTRALLDDMITKGEALQCPECSAVITKKWGCDWVKCSACKTEICWVTRGRRWGPGGRGDTSAGCRCGVDGRRCHPSCGYCH